MTIVRIVFWPGGSVVTGRDLIVLADDTGHRAVPLWLRVSKELWRLLDRPGVFLAGRGQVELRNPQLESLPAIQQQPGRSQEH